MAIKKIPFMRRVEKDDRMLGIIRVLTTENEQKLNEHGRKIGQLYGINSVSHCIPHQKQGIYDRPSLKEAIPKIVSLATKMTNRYHLSAITISCASDPELYEVRKNVRIPIFGAGVCGSHVALMIGDKIGVIGITQTIPQNMKFVLGKSLLAYVHAASLNKTTDLLSKGAKKELLKLTSHLVNEGADVILFACTGFSTIQLKAYLENYIEIPIIDLVEAQAIAYQLTER